MIYLDYAASTPLHPELMEKLPIAYGFLGNAQSDQMTELHQIVEESKEKICRYFSGDAQRLFFTSGATESISTAIIGAARFYKRSGNHIITFETEHKATLSAVFALEEEGFKVSVLKTKPDGKIDYDLLSQEITSETILISVNGLCNETGVLQDLNPLIDIQKNQGVMLHLDACQMMGKVTFDIQELPFDFISLSSHKCYGPQGIGALYIGKNRHIAPIIHGSNSVRSGTLSVAMIYLMGEAYHLLKRDFEANLAKVKSLRDAFITGLEGLSYQVLSDSPYIVNICFEDACDTDIQKIREKIYCQTSSACSQGASHVLQSRLGYLKAKRCVRFSFGIDMNTETIKDACKIIHLIFSDRA